MPNSNYVKGVKKERFFVNRAKSEGKISFRSAGSHSPIDVVIIDLQARRIEFLQCKPESMSNSKKEKLEQELKNLNNEFSCSFRVV